MSLDVDKLGQFDHFEHPVQMIMAAERIYWVGDERIQCPHYRPPRVLWLHPEETRKPVSVTYNIQTVQLHWYSFPFRTLGWEIFVRMNLCPCGTLYIQDNRYQNEWKSAMELELYGNVSRWERRYKEGLRGVIRDEDDDNEDDDDNE